MAGVTGGHEICGRCLVHPDSRVSIMAFPASGLAEMAPSTNPRALREWAADILRQDGARFEVNDTTGRFEAISTWHGDPVCSYHLWILAEAEMRRNYG